jgi:hypothetical protein
MTPMEIKFYIPKDETIPIQLRLKVDGMDVYYEKVEGEFAYDFTLFDKAKKKSTEIIDRIVSIMCNQSYDHGSEWREIKAKRSIVYSPVEEWDHMIIRVYFRVKDSY